MSDVPVLLEGLSLPGKDVGRLGSGDGCGGVILRGEDIARAPTNGGTELLQSLNENGSLDGPEKVKERCRNKLSSAHARSFDSNAQ